MQASGKGQLAMPKMLCCCFVERAEAVEVEGLGAGGGARRLKKLMQFARWKRKGEAMTLAGDPRRG